MRYSLEALCANLIRRLRSRWGPARFARARYGPKGGGILARSGPRRSASDRGRLWRYKPAGTNSASSGSARWGPPALRAFRWQPLERWKTSSFWREFAVFGAALASVSLAVSSAPASTISSIAGSYDGATTGETFSFTEPSSVNYSPTQSYTGSYGDMSVDLTGSMATVVAGVNEIIDVSLGSLVFSPDASDTVTFNFGEATASLYSLTLGTISLFYGVIEAPISSLVFSGPNAPVYEADFTNFANHGGLLALTYNGLSLTPDGATAPASPSGSFTLVADPLPEPGSALLGLSGVAAFGLAELARQLRSRNSIALHESPDS